MEIEIPTAKSLYIEMYFGETLLSSGTAIAVANNRESHCTLITNRHNVTGRNQDTGKCISPNAAIPDSIAIYFHKNTESFEDIGNEWVKFKMPLFRGDETPYWVEHPRLGASADIVALNIKFGNDITIYPYYFETDHDKVNLVISPAENVSVIGFPFGLSSYGKLPIWATGFLAQELSLVNPDKPIFLIDCRTRQGQSGSPVIAFRTSGYRSIKSGVTSSSLSGNTVWEFLGVYSGRVNSESDLGIVWHASAVQELLNEAAADYERRIALSNPESASTSL